MSAGPKDPAAFNPTVACPKHMVFGPCADVGADGSCEVPETSGGPGRCTFLDVPVPRWLGRGSIDVAIVPSSTARSSSSPSPDARPLIMSELPDTGNDTAAMRSVARRLAGRVDAALFGDVNWGRVRLPPSYRAALVQECGLAAWPGINARDRNRVALEGELLALADLGVAGVHCVTGNHTVSGDRPDATAVFDLDSTRLAALATGTGLRVSVAASPHTLPVSARPMRTADKAMAGAELCMVDQPASAGEVAAFIAATRDAGAATMGFVPVVMIVTSLDDLDRWRQYPNARIPSGWTDELAAAASVPERGTALATAFARELLAVDGVDGILLAAAAAPDRAADVAALFADTAEALHA